MCFWYQPKKNDFNDDIINYVSKLDYDFEERTISGNVNRGKEI